MLFTGTSYHNLDSKGRLAIPARFREGREEMEGGAARLVLLNGPERNLVVYPYDQWETIVLKLNSLSQFDPKVQAVRRLFVASAADCECDRQGRILLPPATRQVLPEGELAIVGMGLNFEIWSRELWDQTMAARDLAEVAAFAAELGI